MVKPITLILAGGVSLGTYEGGVVSELLFALEQENQKHPEDPFVIDVMTGASAGSITAALTAKMMLHNYKEMENTLYDVWVKKADITHLMQGASLHSILSNSFQFDLTREYLYGPAHDTFSKGLPATCAPEKLTLGFSLSNQVGIDYGFQYAASYQQDDAYKNFPTTFYADFRAFPVSKENRYLSSLWEEIARTVVASSSFPLFFPPVTLKRTKKDYPNALEESINFLPSEMSYVDGGLFNNEPIKQAITLSKNQDNGKLHPNRLFLFIDPNLNTSDQNLNFTEPQPFMAQLSRLFQMIFGQAVAKEWLQISATNDQLKWRDQTVNLLADMVDSLPEEALKKHIQTIRELDCTPNTFQIEDAKNRLNASDNACKKELLAHLSALINKTARLESKLPINIHLIGSHAEKTAGDALFGFAGFFEEKWREFDFQLGQNDACKRLPEILSIPPYPKKTSGISFQEEWKTLSDITIKDASSAKRKRFADMTLKKMAKVIRQKPMEISGIKHWIAKRVLKNALYKFLHLDKKASWYNPLTWG